MPNAVKVLRRNARRYEELSARIHSRVNPLTDAEREEMAGCRQVLDALGAKEYRGSGRSLSDYETKVLADRAARAKREQTAREDCDRLRAAGITCPMCGGIVHPAEDDGEMPALDIEKSPSAGLGYFIPHEPV